MVHQNNIFQVCAEYTNPQCITSHFVPNKLNMKARDASEESVDQLWGVPMGPTLEPSL